MNNEYAIEERRETGIASRNTQTEMMISRQAQEVQAAIVIAKRFPRDTVESFNRVMEACKRPKLAENAIYEYPRGSEKVSGPSIRLAEAIAQNWGNIDFGITELVTNIVWKGRKGSAARTLIVTLVDDSGYKHARSGVDVEQGHQVLFTYNGEELFRGIIMSQTQTQKKTMKFTAYDNGIYLSNNKDTFTYENKTADQIFTDVCDRFGLPTGTVASCSYKIPELTKPKTTAFDAICDALSLDYDATGVRHYVSSSKGNLSLKVRKENVMQWVIEPEHNLITYSYTRSIEDVKTRVKMISKEGTTLASKTDSDLEEKIGIMQEIQQPDESLTTAQIKDLVDSVLANLSTPARTMDVKAVGIADVISGVAVRVIVPDLDIARTFYVDEDSHEFEDNKHTMTLKLNYSNDTEG